MNKQGKGKIEWTDWAWNPITGCLNGCWYCYARKMYERFHKDFRPAMHYNRLSQPLKCKKPAKIFTCSVSDFWGKGVEPIWREEVYNIMKACPEHTFQLLTKQPQNIVQSERIPENTWIGVSYTFENDYGKIGILRDIPNIRRFVSFEPLMGSLICTLDGIDWVIIGALTPQNSKYAPQLNWIMNIVECAKKFDVPVFMKNNLQSYWKGKLMREFPMVK